MLEKLTAPLRYLEKQTSKMPFMSVIYFIMTVMVLHVPIYLLFFVPGMYKNEIHSSIIVPDWPLIGNILLVIHIAAAVPAILIGPFLFTPDWRKNRPDLHRFFGKIYVYGCLISAVLVIPLAINNGGPMIEPKIGFTIMAILWFCTTWWAFMAARNKDFVAHRRWIMRSYAMTFAFIHVNLTYKLIGVYHLDMVQVKIMQSMVSWMSNLLIVEIYLAGTTHTGKFLGFKKWFKNMAKRSKFDKFYWRFQKSPFVKAKKAN